ncbi:MAG: ABC transporter ATP-binding protein/permease [Flavobacteriales bacterium]|nr:ABC transporter ATP-binding protein/permease [Flavobacteriales bacterium]
MKSLLYLNKYLWKYRMRLGFGILFIVISKLFSVFPAQIVRRAFNEVGNYVHIYKLFDATESHDLIKSDITKTLLIYAALIVGFALLNGIFLFLTRQTIIIMSRYIEYDLKNEIFDQYQRLSSSFYRKNNTGDLMNRISEDVGKVRMYVGPAIMYTINLVVLFVIVLVTMLNVNAELTLYSVLPLPILSFTIYYVSNIINKKSAHVQKQLSELSTSAQETFSGIRILKSYNRLDQFAEKFLKQSNNYKDSSMSLVKTNAIFHPAMILLVGLSTILTVFVGGMLCIEGSLSPGNIAEFIIYVNMLTWPVAALGWVTSLMQQAAASQDRINEFLQAEQEIKNGTAKVNNIEGTIEFENVYLKYENADINALEALTFRIEKGQTLGILGRTGSGKTTIANLICKQYLPTQGVIRVDGHNLNDIPNEVLKPALGYVPQDVYLFSETISNNISFETEARSDKDLEHIINSAKLAHVDHNIKGLADGYDTMLGERGVNLSGGQKQRISIARALYKEPKILVLDDCLSAVDTETETLILKNLENFSTDITTIIMSHRISTLKFADQIIVIGEGRILEKGTHEELLKNAGEYANIHQQQLLEEADF